MNNTNTKKVFFLRLLDKIETIGNALPNPATLFVILSFIIIVISDISARMGLSVTFDIYDPSQNTLIEETTYAVSLLSADGIRFMLTSFVSNFTGFFPLGTVFTIMIGVAVAEGTGLLGTTLRKLAKITPKYALTPVVVFLGIISNIASSVGYVVLVPLAAVLFISFKRHPIAGLAASFAGVSGGWAANLFIATNDPIFAGLTTQAANILDPSYIVLPTDNWYFMIVSTFLITILGTLVTEKIVEPRLSSYTFEESLKVDDITDNEKRGLKWAAISIIIYVLVILILLIPQNSLLRNPETGSILVSPFMSSIIFFMMMFFLIPGVFYGIGAKIIKSDKDIIDMMVKSIEGISGFLVLIFFASQFIAHFGYSNLGIILSIKGSEMLTNIGFVGLPLMVSFIFLTAAINLFLAIDTAKWAIMAPIFVPMFMRLGLSPELTQLAYRIGDSSTNIITPLMPFFPLIVAYAQKYDKKAGIGTLVSIMVPYTIVFLVCWVALFIVWYLIGLPLGPGATLTYPNI